MTMSSVPRYVAFDLETTGVDPFNDVPVSYAFVEFVAPTGTRITNVKAGLTNPGVPIPEGASAIHGIYDGDVALATPLSVVVEGIAALITSLWSRGVILVGMNPSYDLTMVNSLCARLGLPTLEERGPIGPVLDTLILDKHFDTYRKGGRKLVDLCAHYQVTLTDAHSAAADSEASLLVLEALLAKYPQILDIPPNQINETLSLWNTVSLRSLSKYLEKKGDPPVPEGRYYWPINTAD